MRRWHSAYSAQYTANSPCRTLEVGGVRVWFDDVPQPRRAASIAAMSIFFICIIASNARLAAATSGSVIAFVMAIGVICQDNPHLSLHQPHALSWPPLSTIAFQ